MPHNKLNNIFTYEKKLIRHYGKSNNLYKHIC